MLEGISGTERRLQRSRRSLARTTSSLPFENKGVCTKTETHDKDGECLPEKVENSEPIALVIDAFFDKMAMRSLTT